MFLHAFLTKLGSPVYRGILQCGWVDPTSPPQQPAGPPDQWCVNSDHGAMPGVWASWVQLMWNKKEMSRLDATLTRVKFALPFDFWPWIFKVKLYLGNGRPDCHGTKGTGVDKMSWYETLRKWVNWMLHWLGYLWSWPLTFKFKL